MGVVFLIFAVIFVLGPIARAYAQRISQELPPGLHGEMAEMAKLRDEVDRLGQEVARLQEEHSFMVRLLTDGERKRLRGGSPPEG